MGKPAKIFLVICMSLIGVVIILAQLLEHRDLVKYDERGITVKAVVDEKENADVHVTQGTYSTRNTVWVNAIIGKDSVRSMLTDFVDDEMWAKFKKGDELQIIYLPEDYRRIASFGAELSGKQYSTETFAIAKGRWWYYYLFAGISFFLGFLPFIFKRNSREVS